MKPFLYPAILGHLQDLMTAQKGGGGNLCRTTVAVEANLLGAVHK